MKEELSMLYNTLLPLIKDAEHSNAALDSLEELLNSSNELHLIFNIDYYKLLRILYLEMNITSISFYKFIFKQKFHFDFLNFHLNAFIEKIFEKLEDKQILKWDIDFYYQLLACLIENISLSPSWISRAFHICVSDLQWMIGESEDFEIKLRIDILLLIVGLFQEEVEKLINPSNFLEMMFRLTKVLLYWLKNEGGLIY
jgi:hypothetical protein